jgi:hypothetical protein
MNKASEIYYIFNNVNPDNKIAVLWFRLRERVKYMIPYKVKEFYRTKIEVIWKPKHSRIRKIVPKYWVDLDEVLLLVNFEIVKSFYEDEFVNGFVDWTSDKVHRKFGKWLEKAYAYITKGRPELKKAMYDAYPETKGFAKGKMSRLTYNQLYGEVDRLERLIHDTDTKLITELVKQRDFLWT